MKKSTAQYTEPGAENARLIAEAPALLESVEDLTDLVGMLLEADGAYRPETFSSIQKAHDLLVRVKGK